MDYLFVDCVKWLLSCPFVIKAAYSIGMGTAIIISVVTLVRRRLI